MKTFNKLGKKTEVFRVGVVETNSSSSHTLTISMKDDLIKRGDPDLNLTITKDNKLYIPSERVLFGWDWEMFSDCKSRFLYAAALIYSQASCDFNNYKKVQAFKGKIKEYLAVDEVVFQWDLDFMGSTDKEIFGEWIDTSSVDHQSNYEGYLQVFENTDTLIHFIFSRNSLIYTGNDGSDCPEYLLKKVFNCNPTKYKKYYRIIFPSGSIIESIDIESTLIDSPIISISYEDCEVFWNIETNQPDIDRFQKVRVFSNKEEEREYRKRNEEEGTKKLLPLTYGYQDESGKLNALFCSRDILREYLDFESSGLYTETRQVPFLDWFNKKTTLTIGKDYIKFPIEVMYTEFGKINLID